MFHIQFVLQRNNEKNLVDNGLTIMHSTRWHVGFITMIKRKRTTIL